MLAAWELVMSAAGISFAGLFVCLLGGINVYGIISAMPYWCGAILSFSFAALTVLTAVGCIYYAAYLRQLVLAFGRFQHNTLALASGSGTLPPLSISPKSPAKKKHCLRSVALISLTLFTICFILSFIACSISAGSLEFWHTWGWFLN